MRASLPLRAAVACIAMAATAFAAHQSAQPPAAAPVAPTLDAYLPDAFGAWRRAPLGDAVLPAEGELGPGEAVEYRAYTDDLGRLITLVIAYGPPMGDGVRLHRPENCYRAQGFAVVDRAIDRAAGPKGAIPVVHLTTERVARREAVTYWLRDGADFATAEPQRQLFALKRGLERADFRADGALVRVSTGFGAEPNFGIHTEFLADFARALPPAGRRLLMGAKPGDAAPAEAAAS